jgi:hypothetical protein
MFNDVTSHFVGYSAFIEILIKNDLSWWKEQETKEEISLLWVVSD